MNDDSYIMGCCDPEHEDAVVKEYTKIQHVSDGVNHCPPFHSVETHNFYKKRGRVCPYCNNVSVPVPKDKLRELIE